MAKVLALGLLGSKGLSKTTARSGSVPPVKLLAASAEGLAWTAKLVSGKTVEAGKPVIVVAFPTLAESKARGMERRSPTKKLAGFPSCARSRTWRARLPSERASEQLAARLGRVDKQVDTPPPMG